MASKNDYSFQRKAVRTQEELLIEALEVCDTDILYDETLPLEDEELPHDIDELNFDDGSRI